MRCFLSTSNSPHRPMNRRLCTSTGTARAVPVRLPYPMPCKQRLRALIGLGFFFVGCACVGQVHVHAMSMFANERRCRLLSVPVLYGEVVCTLLRANCCAAARDNGKQELAMQQEMIWSMAPTDSGERYGRASQGLVGRISGLGVVFTVSDVASLATPAHALAPKRPHALQTTSPRRVRHHRCQHHTDLTSLDAHDAQSTPWPREIDT